MLAAAEQMRRLLRGVVEVIAPQEFEQRLAQDRPLRVKAGFDPTAPDLHLGHTVLLYKMRQFQELGHDVTFLIGDFTGMVGDPTGVSETRRALTQDEVKRNAETYKQQVFKILDPACTTIRFNSEWLAGMNGLDFIRLGASMTVARMLERDDFRKRFQEQRPISVHEFYYPLIQGYDSVALQADVELGGTDQKFNLLVGRDLQRERGQPPQVVLTLPLLEGTDGVRKMSKSYGNAIGIQEPPEMIYGKLMSIPDAAMYRYFELLTDEDLDVIRGLHPKAAKQRLARTMVARFHAPEAADWAERDFETKFARSEFPEDAREVSVRVAPPAALVVVLAEASLCKSRSDARRMLAQGAVEVDGQTIGPDQVEIPLAIGRTYRIRVGKTRFARVRLEPVAG